MCLLTVRPLRNPCCRAARHANRSTDFRVRWGRITTGLLLLWGCGATANADDVDLRKQTDSFVKTNCLHCHGPDEAKGELRLDRLTFGGSQPKEFETWRKILDRVEAGEMPPRGEPRPDGAQTRAFTKHLVDALVKVAAQERTEGRVVLRRLNRVEYENTVRDLFAVNVSVKQMLPEDAAAHGFDNIGAALHVSPVLMERYLEAADAVLDAAIAPVHQLPSKTERFDLYESLPKWFLNGVWKQDEGVILFRNSGDSASDLRQFRAPAPGRYRFRISASAHNSQTPLPLAVTVGNFVVSGNPTRQVGYFDAPPGEPAVIELEERLAAKNDTIKVTPVGLPYVYLKPETMAEYPGPGLHIHWIEVEGPLPEAWPTAGYRHVFGDADPKTGTAADADAVLHAILPRAFRRSVTEAEEQPYRKIVADALAAGRPFSAALRMGLKAVLTSPKFLYLREPQNELDDFALASRLSYFLWSTMPDDTLLATAGRGELRRPEILRAQIARMLQDPKSAALTENFTGQWLSLRDIRATTPDKTLYPEYDELLEWSAVRETRLFFDELLRRDLSVTQFIDSDFAIINGRLAKHYQIPDVDGVEFRKVALRPEYHRGGVLTQASVLKVTANGTNTSPVTRGVFVLDRLLGRPPSPPPPNVPAVEPDIRGAVTIREQLAKHRTTENCSGCHARIDPAGFALESYDVIGGYRERYRTVGGDRKQWVNNRVGPLAKYLAAYQYGLGREVETADALPDGRAFADLAELKRLLLADRERIARNMAEKLLTYATGSPVTPADRPAVDRILARAQASDYGLRSLVEAVITDPVFLRK